jgi:hypothetical protein
VNYQQHSSLSGLIHITPSTDELGTVICLQLYLGTKSDCRRAGMLIERMQHMTSLAIHLDEERLPKSIGSGYEGSGLAAIRTLFIGKTQARRCPNLKALRIESMWFSSAGDVLPTLLDLGKLEHLQLSQCNQTNRLYESLSQLQLKLRSFTDEFSCNGHHQGLHNMPAGSQISTSAFLSSLKGIQKFRLRGTPCDWRIETFDWAALASNASSICILEMTDYRGNGPFSKLSSTPISPGTALPGFRALCENATHLQQLSICGPEVDASDWNSAHGLKVMIVRHSFLSYRTHLLT